MWWRSMQLEVTVSQWELEEMDSFRRNCVFMGPLHTHTHTLLHNNNNIYFRMDVSRTPNISHTQELKSNIIVYGG